MADNEISLRPIFDTLRRYRKFIAAALAAILAVYGIMGLAAFLLQPSEWIASLGFRLMFEGVDKGEYPNGTRFSTAEIVSTPVLTEVFANDSLDRYFPDFEHFKNSVFMMESNPDLNLLDFDYQAKLSDKSLSPVDRARIENEYRDKRKSLTAPQYTLNFRRGGREVTIPSPLMNKFLNNIVATWAQQAAQRKGALSYNIPVYSRSILQKEFIDNEDYLIAVDILRSKIVRIQSSIDAIAKLPGAETIRAGPERISLGEIRANLDDIIRYKLQPIVAMIRAAGLSKDPQSLVTYFESQLFQAKLEREEARNKVKILQDSLRAYMSERGAMAVQGAQTAPGSGAASRLPGNLETPAMIPQFGESFLDRLVAISSQNADVKYRQDLIDRIISAGIPTASLEKETMYYESVILILKGFRAGSDRAFATAAKQIVRTKTEEALAGALKTLDQLSSLYRELSIQNLNPQTMLYRITQPFSTRTERSLTLNTVALYGAFIFLLALILVPISCLVHDYFKSNIADSKARHSLWPESTEEPVPKIDQ